MKYFLALMLCAVPASAQIIVSSGTPLSQQLETIKLQTEVACLMAAAKQGAGDCTAASGGGAGLSSTQTWSGGNTLYGGTTFYGTVAITSAAFQSMAANGYLELGPLFYQWGQYTGGVNSPAISYPIVFTTLYGVTGSVTLSSALNGSMLEIISPTTSGFTGNQRRHDAVALTDNFYWWAWGRR